MRIFGAKTSKLSLTFISRDIPSKPAEKQKNEGAINEKERFNGS